MNPLIYSAILNFVRPPGVGPGTFPYKTDILIAGLLGDREIKVHPPQQTGDGACARMRLGLFLAGAAEFVL